MLIQPRLLAQSGMDVVYGGGGIGLMGKLADAVIEDRGNEEWRKIAKI